MKTLARSFVALLAFAFAFPPVAPAAAVVQPSPVPTPVAGQTVTYTYKTFAEPQRYGPGLLGDLNQNFGMLTLTFNANGIIQGRYKPDYGNFTSVTGGVLNKHDVWFTIGRTRFSGHFTRHGIVADSGLMPNGMTYRLFAAFQHA